MGVEADVHIHPWKVLCVVCIGFAIQIVYWSVLNLIILQRISVILYLLEHLCSLFVLLQMCVCECVCACVRACVRACVCVCVCEAMGWVKFHVHSDDQNTKDTGRP